MEKMKPIPLPKSEEEDPVKLRDFYLLIATVNELIENQNLLDKLAIRVARLEVYYKAHRKEHSKNARNKV